MSLAFIHRGEKSLTSLSQILNIRTPSSFSVFLLCVIDQTIKKPLKVYLSKFMRENHNIAEEKIKNYREIFHQTCDKIVNYLGKKPFHLRAGVNPPALDTVMAVFSHHLNSIPDDISERYERLKQDDVFYKTTKQATTDQSSINLRFERVNSLLFEE